MAEIKQVDLADVDPNPYRNLETYPWVETKIEHLMRSIADVGFWEGIIARPVGSRVETAFGHHRIEAARRMQMLTVPLILRPLSDRDMLCFMGRENGEDYRSDFLSMLNTWEGAVAFSKGYKICEAAASQNPKPTEIATLLGWTHQHGSGRGLQMSATAATCAAAYELIRGQHMSRDDLRGLSVRDAREIVVPSHKEIEGLARFGEREKRDHKITKAAQKVVARSAQFTAKDVRDGKIAQKSIRNEVRANIMRFMISLELMMRCR